MNRRQPSGALWTFLAVAIAAAMVYLALPPRSRQSPTSATQPIEISDERYEPADLLPSRPATRPADPRIAVVLDALAAYLSEYGEHPVGSNAEIAAALLGDNPRKLRVLARNKADLDKDGRLLDPWDNPYFFHQISGRVIELRSAGPDGKLRSEDDILLVSQD